MFEASYSSLFHWTGTCSTAEQKFPVRLSVSAGKGVSLLSFAIL